MSHDVTLLVDVAQGLGEPRIFLSVSFVFECFVSSYLFCAYDVILQMVQNAGKDDKRILVVSQYYCTHGRNYAVVMFCDYENILWGCAYNNMLTKGTIVSHH